MSESRYRLGEELGRGALGRVVRVHDDESGELLAGKILHASQRADPRALARFSGEARLLAGIRHPNLVAVRGLVEIAGERVLLMELVDGPNLATEVATTAAVGAPMPAARIAQLGRGIAAGLAEAHRAGLIHRDLKPANVLVGADGEPKIVDFGLARARSFAGVEPDAFAVVGTPDYMAPEALDPLAVDGRSDLYALGCILHELATGRPPYGGATAFAVLEAHRNAPLPALDGVPRALAPLIRWLLAKSPADRPQSAAAVERALGAVAAADSALASAAGTALVPAAAGTALAAPAGTALAAAGTGSSCAHCGAPCLAEVHVCFRCRRPQVTLSRGGHTVFAIGPGEMAHKLDAGLRQRLLDWVRANPSLGLDPKPLAKSVPRLPFVIATRISEESAEALAAALRALGLEPAVREGGRFSLPQMRRKALTLSGRMTLIAMGGWFPAVQHMSGLIMLPMFGAIGVATMASGFVAAGRAIALPSGRTSGALPPAIDQPLRRLTAVVPAIEAERHRDSLRGVVSRALALRAAVPEAERAAVDADLGRLIDLATVASTRVDELEQTLAAADPRSADDTLRRQLRERDAWAARLLEVTAFLDALRARWAAITTAAAASDDLAELRAHIEALEEVQRL